MKTQGRPVSTNIEDRRPSQAQIDANDLQNQKNYAFLQESYGSAATWKGTQSYNKFQPINGPRPSAVQGPPNIDPGFVFVRTKEGDGTWK